MDTVVKFLSESNAIEGINRAVTRSEISVSQHFLTLRKPTVADLCTCVYVFEPGAVLRAIPGMGVRIADYIAPPGGPRIVKDLESMMLDLPVLPPHIFHKRYQALHPFTDGNGRTGRLLWLWQMHAQGHQIYKTFLQTWYYQSLEK